MIIGIRVLIIGIRVLIIALEYEVVREPRERIDRPALQRPDRLEGRHLRTWSCPIPAQMWEGASPVLVQTWQRGCPVPVQMWEGASPSPGADVAGLIPSRNAAHAAAAEGGRTFCLMLSPTARKCVPIDLRGSSMHSHLRAPAGQVRHACKGADATQHAAAR